MKTLLKYPLIAIFLLSIFVVSFNIVSATPITTCQVINVSGVYDLSNSLNYTGDGINCLDIQSDNVTINGHGFNLTGDFPQVSHNVIQRGIRTNSFSNITIKNIKIYNSDYGIDLESSANVVIVNATTNDMSSFGIVNAGDNTTLLNIEASGNQNSGISAENGRNNLLIDNLIMNGNHCDGLIFSANNAIISNVFSVNNSNICGGQAIAPYSSSNLTFNTIILTDEVDTAFALGTDTLNTRINNLMIVDDIGSFQEGGGFYYFLQYGNSHNTTITNFSIITQSGSILFSNLVVPDDANINLNNSGVNRNNFAFVDSNVLPFLNVSSKISLNSIPIFDAPVIYRNGVICPSNICTNITALNQSNVQFNVTGWSSYSINNQTIPVPPTPPALTAKDSQIYKNFASIGAGLGLLMSYLGLTLGSFIIVIAIASLVGVLFYGIYLVLRSFMSDYIFTHGNLETPF